MASEPIETERTPPPVGWDIEEFGEVDSTHRILEERIQDRPVDRHVILARTQQGGRGRRGARWESPAGGLWFSFSLLTPAAPDPFLGLLVAEACRASLSDLDPRGPARFRLKWPNDLIAGDRKCGGILATTRSLPGGDTLLLFGVGLNLDLHNDELPKVSQPITSFRQEFGWSPSPLDALHRILLRIDAERERDRSVGRAASIASLSEVMSTLGATIRWKEANGALTTGTALRLESDGSLRVCDASGKEATLHSGEIEHLRGLA